MNKTYSSKLSGYVFLLTILTIGTIAFTIQAQDFGITGDVIGTNFYIEYESATDSYYRVVSATSLTGSVWNMKHMRLGVQIGF